MTSRPPMLSVDEAQRIVLSEITAGEIETVPLLDALGRVLREDVKATHDLPRADNSAMDGYAVRADDLSTVPVTLRVTGDIAAGHPAKTSVEAGTAMRIMTGAFVPRGADTVVQVELTDGGTETVTIAKALPAGANIRRRGEDLREGSVSLHDGARIAAAGLALLAAAQKKDVVVGRKPVVAILSTGDELVDINEPLGADNIVNTNAYLLAGLVRQAGGTPRMLGTVRDTKEATIAAFEEALQSDVVISSGGVSVGAYDFVKAALEELGAETRFWRVAMKPGKPVVLSRLRDRVVFGLPGNPASCFVSFHLFVAPALRKMCGESEPHVPAAVNVRTTSPLRSGGDRRLYVRVRVTSRDGELVAEPLSSQGSGSLTSMAGANALAIVDAGVKSVDAGAIVPALIIGDLR